MKVSIISCINPGQEYPAVVEFAPFQKISKKKLKKKDAKAGSIEEGMCFRAVLIANNYTCLYVDLENKSLLYTI